LQRLTWRELHVLGYLEDGKSNAEIGKALGISPRSYGCTWRTSTRGSAGTAERPRSHASGRCETPIPSRPIGAHG
jgi:FixJ family two-component response regulator